MRRNIRICHGCEYRVRNCNGPCPCTADAAGRDIIVLAMTGACPKGYFVNAPPAPSIIPASSPRLWASDRGAELWGKIHRWALTQPPEADGLKWLMGFLGELPCGVCRNDAKAYITANPPTWGAETFSWSVGFHNAVNRRLGKTEVGEDEAREFWQSGSVSAAISIRPTD